MSIIIQPDTGEIRRYERSDEEESILGKSEAARFDDGKNRFDLLPPWSIDQIAQVYTYGTIKYDDDNWRKGMPWRKVIGPLLRHLFKWLRGERWDNESGLHHLSHCAWQCMALMEYERCNIGKDNRNPYDLDLMDEEQRNKRITKWKELANQNKLENYNGLEVDLLYECSEKSCSGDCSNCSKIDPEVAPPGTFFPS